MKHTLLAIAFSVMSLASVYYIVYINKRMGEWFLVANILLFVFCVIKGIIETDD